MPSLQRARRASEHSFSRVLREMFHLIISARVVPDWLLRAGIDKARLVIGLGDFSMAPGLGSLSAPEHARARARCLGRDEDEDGDDDDESGRPAVTAAAAENLADHGTMCHSALWRWHKARRKWLDRGGLDVVLFPAVARAPDPHAMLLDCIFCWRGGTGGGGGGGPRWPHVEHAWAGMQEWYPTVHCSLSDHYSVESIQKTGPDRVKMVCTYSPPITR
ncbi:MAG: phospholipase C type enzyme [Phylliscum demangeonii]|nr:MAG: phospholipase C type enzyme [Phylliscum demangeonii]